MRITKPIERWFDVPDDPDKGRLLIKYLSPGEVSDIFDEVIKQVVNYTKGESGNLEPVFSQVTDKKKDRELTLIKSVVGWENVFDQDGKALEFNADNLVRASREIQGFNELVAKFRAKLAKDIDQEKKDQEKNLPSSARKLAK